jgi:hypothetical protein
LQRAPLTSQHGDADLDSAARVLLRDWAHGAFPFYVVPPKSASAANGASGASARAEVDEVLAAMRTRKEMRTSGKGLVRFRTSDEEEREVSKVLCCRVAGEGRREGIELTRECGADGADCAG